jgi:hypothetical protein
VPDELLADSRLQEPSTVSIRSSLQRAIRPSRTQGVGRLWAKSLLNAALFFGVFMVALPWTAHRLLPIPVALPAAVQTAAAHQLVVHIEEPELLARFGDGYTEYRSRVPRWIPRLATRGPGKGLEGRS